MNVTNSNDLIELVFSSFFFLLSHQTVDCTQKWKIHPNARTWNAQNILEWLENGEDRNPHVKAVCCFDEKKNHLMAIFRTIDYKGETHNVIFAHVLIISQNLCIWISLTLSANKIRNIPEHHVRDFFSREQHTENLIISSSISYLLQSVLRVKDDKKKKCSM